MALPQRKSQENNESGTPGPYQYQVRNAQRQGFKDRKLNDDFEYLNEGVVSKYASNDEQFNAEYSKQGLQPQGVGRVERPEREASNDESFETGGRSGPSNLQKLNQLRKTSKLKKKTTKALVKRALVKTRVSAVNASIMAWGFWVWVTQAIFALISIIFFATTSAYLAIFESKNWVSSAISFVTGFIKDISSYIGIGVGPADIGMGIFLVFYILAMVIGLITLFVAYFQYLMAMLHPLSGKAAGMKWGVLLLAIIGYCIPIINILPWFLVCLLVVWKYPK